MQYSDLPPRIPVPFAESGLKNTIPVPSQVSITPGAASFTTGFPPLTMTPVAAGGVPPFGQDMNGILFDESSWSRWVSAGGTVEYDATFSTDIGGYPAGAVLKAASGADLWFSTADNNTTDPDAGGAGWVRVTAGRLINVQVFTSSGTYTPTPGMGSVVVEVLGGGGAGGGGIQPFSGNVSLGAPGGAGSFGSGRFTAASVGVSQAVTVGAGGVPGFGASGGNGGTSSFGALLSAPGGAGGLMLNNQVPPSINGNGVPSSAPSGANISSGRGGTGSVAFAVNASIGHGGEGGASRAGGGAAGNAINANGANAASPGSGGSGSAINNGGGGNYSGGAGAAGLVVVWEYS